MKSIRPSCRALLMVPAALSLALGACGGDDDIRPPTPMAKQAACQSLVPAALGGPMPEGDTAVIRWLGTSNFEVTYRGKIILMDTYYNRPPRTRSIGFTAEQVKKADAILIGHAHSDHISDVALIAAQTGAPVLGSVISTTTAQVLGVPAAQTQTVKGDNTEKFQYGDITVQPTHIVHSTIEAGLAPALRKLYDNDALSPLTPEEQAQSTEVSSRGSRDPNLGAQGTMGFMLTLGRDFNIVWFDSVGDTSPEERALQQQIGEGVDVGIFPWTPHPIAETQLTYTFPHLQLFKPKLYLPTHQDHIWNLWLDSGLEPLFMKIRDELPQTSYLSPLYRSPVCISTSGSNKGETAIKY